MSVHPIITVNLILPNTYTRIRVLRRGLLSTRPNWQCLGSWDT